MRVYVGISKSNESRKNAYPSLQHQSICVYTHSIGGIVFYVGHGTPVRPYELGGGRSPTRNAKWLETILTHRYYDVEIVEWFDSKNEAIKKENELIGQYKPKGNIPVKGVKKGPYRKSNV